MPLPPHVVARASRTCSVHVSACQGRARPDVPGIFRTMPEDAGGFPRGRNGVGSFEYALFRFPSRADRRSNVRSFVFLRSTARPSLPVGWASVAGKCIVSRTFGIRPKSTASPKRCVRSGTVSNSRSRRRDPEPEAFDFGPGLARKFGSPRTGRVVDRIDLGCEPRWARRRIDLHLVKNPSLSVVQMENSESNFTIRQKNG